jgi:hypothetical protein
MFDSLDGEVLQKLAALEDKKQIRSVLKLGDVLACLEQAVKECHLQTASGAGEGGSFQQAAIGLQACQRIIEKWWQTDS